MDDNLRKGNSNNILFVHEAKTLLINMNEYSGLKPQVLCTVHVYYINAVGHEGDHGT
jgi:hypothetical protein